MAKARVIDRDRGWKAIRREAKRSGGAHVAVGILEGAGARNDGELTNAMLGSVHEYGSPESGIKERSFLRATIDERLRDYRKLVKRLGELIVTKKLTTEQALDMFGMRVVADVKRRIQAGIDPALAPETIARKGSSKQLIDTGQLVNSITHEVRR